MTASSKEMQRKLGSEREDVQIPRVQRRGPPPTLVQIREARVRSPISHPAKWR
jgi:hypothetical protein